MDARAQNVKTKDIWVSLGLSEIRELHPEMAKKLADMLEGPITEAAMNGKMRDESGFLILDALQERAKLTKELM